jgi:hypothetical protein
VDGSIVFSKKDSRLVKSAEGHGFKLSITEFKVVDGLQVRAQVKFVISPDRFFAWVMTYPSRGSKLSLITLKTVTSKWRSSAWIVQAADNKTAGILFFNLRFVATT